MSPLETANHLPPRTDPVGLRPVRGAPLAAARIESLTGLRIFPALAVCLSHLGAPLGSPGPVRAFFAAGYSGVTVFFLLSGFVLAYNYFEPLTARFSLRSLWSFASLVSLGSIPSTS